MNREDLVFATCHQLAQIVSDDWEDRPPEITTTIKLLEPVDEPGEPFRGPSLVNNPLSLTLSEKEPEHYRIHMRLMQLTTINKLFSIILKYSDGWETKNSDVIKREIISRIADYERQSKELTTPMLDYRHIELQQ